MKRLVSIFMFTCFAVMSVFTGTSHAQKAPYVLGVVLDMTGRQSTFGIGQKRGMEITLAEINASGGVNGRQLKAIYLDSESDPAKAVIHTKRLIEVDKVVVLTGYPSVAGTLASQQSAELAKIPLVSSTPIEAEGSKVKKWVFTINGGQKKISLPMLLEMMVKKGVKKIAYLYIDNSFGQTGFKVIDEAAKNMNVKLEVVEKYAVGSTDLGPQITHIKTSGADGLIITGNVPDTTLAIKNARDLNFIAPIYCDAGIVSPDFISLAGKNGVGIISTSLKTLVANDLPSNDLQKKVCVNFYNAYTKQYGVFSLFAGHSWDQIQLITAALKKVDPKLDPTKEGDLEKIREQFRDNYENIKGFVGQNGIFTLSPTNHNGLPDKCYVPVVIQNGKWVLYKK